MAEDTQAVTEQTPSSAGSQNTEPGPVPYERFQQVNTALADLKKWKAQIEAEQAKHAKEAEAAEAAKLAEQQQYKELNDKTVGKLTAAEQRIKELEARDRAHQIERAFRAQAQTMGLKFANERAADTAFKLLPIDTLEVDEQGAVGGLDKALKALKDSDGYLFAEAQQDKPAVTPIDARAGLRSTPVASQTQDEREADARRRLRL